MNVIQMLNVWKYFRRDTLKPLIDDEELEFPTWFYGGIDRCSRFWDKPTKYNLTAMNSWIFAIDRLWKEEYPQWFYYDADVTIMSWLEGYDPESSKEVYRTWLNRKENEALGIGD